MKYSEIISTLKTSELSCIKGRGDAAFAFRYISFLSRKLRLDNSCFVVSYVLFECSTPGAKIHFALDPEKNAHSWFELDGVDYTTDRLFKSPPFESITK
jgi:hypothetical protein